MIHHYSKNGTTIRHAEHMQQTNTGVLLERGVFCELVWLAGFFLLALKGSEGRSVPLPSAFIWFDWASFSLRSTISECCFVSLSSFTSSRMHTDPCCMPDCSTRCDDALAPSQSFVIDHRKAFHPQTFLLFHPKCSSYPPSHPLNSPKNHKKGALISTRTPTKCLMLLFSLWTSFQ